MTFSEGNMNNVAVSYEVWMYLYTLCSMMRTVRERLERIFSKSAYDFELDSKPRRKPFTHVLLDLSHYDSDALVQGSLHLLNRFFSEELAVFDSAVQTQLLQTDKSIAVSATFVHQ